MATKLPGRNNAVGYWGRNIHQRVDNEFIPQKIRVLLQDKLLSRGKDVYLWQQVVDDTPGSLGCSCVKSTTESPSITCASCYGTKLVPGYIRFGHETLYFASVTPVLLYGMELDKSFKPYRLRLSDNVLSGHATSPRLQFSNPNGCDWDFRLDAATIVGTSLIDVSFSTDGLNYYPLGEINDADKKPIGVGGIYLRVAMARAQAADRSPEFEIVRIRHIKQADTHLKILRPQVTELPILMQYGFRAENVGERFWTVPLDFFDPTIPANTPMARIQENSFYQRVSGINSEARFVTAKLSYNEEFEIFSHQSFEPRRAQAQEAFTRLVF